jgi:serine phosphatase RsbU (regulator of sigma subunit)
MHREPLLAQEDSSVLVVLGDVSGKGLKAAMTVSLIVGGLSALVQRTPEPREILHGLNHLLTGRGEGGFTTCLVLRITASGEATLANAGHLAPFREGQELPVAGSLPLGLSKDAVYDDLVFHLQVGETLTLYTDGILEARNARGGLYGFERLAELLGRKPSVEQIVETACSFGQQDDITVLSVARTAASQPDSARLNLTTQIASV